MTTQQVEEKPHSKPNLAAQPQHVRTKRELLNLPANPSAKTPQAKSKDGIIPAVQREVARLWLRGYSMPEIMEKAGVVNKSTLLKYIIAVRDDLKALSTKKHEERVNEAIGSLRVIRAKVWDEIERAKEPVSRLLTIAQKNVELEARITGALTDNLKIEGEIIHKKLYDFKNKLPAPYETNVIEGEFVDEALVGDIDLDKDIADIPDEQLPTLTKEELDAVPVEVHVSNNHPYPASIRYKDV